MYNENTEDFKEQAEDFMSAFGGLLTSMLSTESYADRKIGRYDFPEGFISTVKVSEGDHPYETMIQDSRYGYTRPMGENAGGIIVEAYDTPEAALAAHERWVRLWKSGAFPKTIEDCYNSVTARMAAKWNGPIVYELKDSNGTR